MTTRLYLLVALTMLVACDPLKTATLSGRHGSDNAEPKSSLQDPPDAGETPDAGFSQCWKTREFEAGVDSIAFTFDSQGVGHYAFCRDYEVYLGSTRTGDVATLAGVPSYSRVVDMAVDSQGRRHLLIYDMNIGPAYAYEQQGTWVRTSLGLGSRNETDLLRLKLDAQGFVHIVFLHGIYPEQSLVYVTNRGGVLTSEEPGIRPRRALPHNSVDFELDTQGNVHLVYVDGTANRDIYYATNASGVWVSELVASVRGEHPVLTLDAKGHPHLLYASNYQIYYAGRLSKGRWEFFHVGAAIESQFDLTVDAAGNRHALLYRQSAPFIPSVVYAGLPAGGSQWNVVATISPEWGGDGQANIIHNTIWLDATGQVHIGYYFVTYDKNAKWTGDSIQFAWPCP